jgi:hypothetical protein
MNAYARRSRRNRLTYVGLWAVGTVAYLALALAGYPAVAGGAFLVAGALAVGHHLRAGRLFDERDDEILRTASANTMQAVGLAAGVFFPTTAVLTGLGVIAWPAWLTPIGLFVAALYALWGLQIAYARTRR